MSDFDALRSRVEDAAKTLAQAEAERHHQNEALTGLLGQLECRFDAQQQELEYYRARVRPLEELNEQLAVLMDRLLAMIDQGFGEASVAPLRDAAAHAARILEQDLGMPVPAPAVGTADEFQDAAETDSDDVARFENVGEIELVAETGIEAEDGAELPDVVAAAHQAAAEDASDDDDLIAEMMEAIGGSRDEVGEGESAGPTDMPEIESMDSLVERLAAETAGLGGGEAGPVDIRSVLSRVEAAVEEVRSHVEPVADETNEAAEQRSAVA